MWPAERWSVSTTCQPSPVRRQIRPASRSRVSPVAAVKVPPPTRPVRGPPRPKGRSPPVGKASPASSQREPASTRTVGSAPIATVMLPSPSASRSATPSWNIRPWTGFGRADHDAPPSVECHSAGRESLPPAAIRPCGALVIERTVRSRAVLSRSLTSSGADGWPQVRPSVERQTVGWPWPSSSLTNPPATTAPSGVTATVWSAWRPGPRSVGASISCHSRPSGEYQATPSWLLSTVRVPTATKPSPSAAIPVTDSSPVRSSGPPGPPSTDSQVSPPSRLSHRRGRISPQTFSPPATRMPPSPAAAASPPAVLATRLRRTAPSRRRSGHTAASASPSPTRRRPRGRRRRLRRPSTRCGRSVGDDLGLPAAPSEVHTAVTPSGRVDDRADDRPRSPSPPGAGRRRWRPARRSAAGALGPAEAGGGSVRAASVLSPQAAEPTRARAVRSAAARRPGRPRAAPARAGASPVRRGRTRASRRARDVASKESPPVRGQPSTRVPAVDDSRCSGSGPYNRDRHADTIEAPR